MSKPQISTEFGQSPKFFGLIDYEENLKRGVSSRDMLDFVNANPSLMRGAKQGEVRARMLADAEAEEARKAEKQAKKEDKAQQDIQKGLDQSDYLSQENIEKFQDLLNRLQRSKMQQAEQSARESRRGTFAQGIASMMSNF